MKSGHSGKMYGDFRGALLLSPTLSVHDQWRLIVEYNSVVTEVLSIGKRER